MRHFYENIDSNPAWFDFQDLYREMVNQAKDGAHFVEVGAWLGKSTAFMAVEIANSKKNITFDVVDTFRGDGTMEQIPTIIKHHGSVYHQFLKNLVPARAYIAQVHVMDSGRAAALYDDESLEFVFVDGDHKYIKVLDDNEKWLPKVKKGGIFAGHDIQLAGVSRAVHEILGNDYEVIGTSWLHRRKDDNT